jgi:hypothetical protein
MMEYRKTTQTAFSTSGRTTSHRKPITATAMKTTMSDSTGERSDGGFLRYNFSKFQDSEDESLELRKQDNKNLVAFPLAFDGDFSVFNKKLADDDTKEDSFEKELSSALEQMSIPIETTGSPDTSLDISADLGHFDIRPKTSSTPYDVSNKSWTTPPNINRKDDIGLAYAGIYGTPPQKKISSHGYGTPPQKIKCDEMDTPKTCNTSYNESSLLSDQNSCLAEPVVESSFESMGSEINQNRMRSYFDESFMSTNTNNPDVSFVQATQNSFLDSVDTVVDQFICSLSCDDIKNTPRQKSN